MADTCQCPRTGQYGSATTEIMHTDDCPRRLPRASSPGRTYTRSGTTTPRGHSPSRGLTRESPSRNRNNSPHGPSDPSQLPASNVTGSDLPVSPNLFGQLTQLRLHGEMRNHANQTGLTGFRMVSTVVTATVPGNGRRPAQVSRSPIMITETPSTHAHEGVQFTRTAVLPEPAGQNHSVLRATTDENSRDGEVRSLRP